MLSPSDSGIAIVGMSCRFPGARNYEEFWRNLREGVEAITFFSDEELKEIRDASHPKYVKAGGILGDVEMFDADFFGMNPREAEMTDPQHRIFLECAWEALENAGYDSETYAGVIGIYAGVSKNTYLWLNLFPHRDLIESVGLHQMMIGNEKDFLTTRVSYKLNLKGPGVTVQTACSTSLVAVHLACQSLLNGECDMALAGGVSVRVPEKSGYFYEEGGIFSPDGHCRTFDAGAAGVVPGSGVGIVVLKRLRDALIARDYVYAVIKGSAVNNDGSLKVAYTAPSVEGQMAVIAEALTVAGVDAGSIGYVEAHGTATFLGDPIEIEALTRVFRASTQRTQFCAIGSVKTNIGHADAAAGVAGLIKAVLALKHKMLPPSLHFEKPNPAIDFAASPFYVNTRLNQWECRGGPRRACVHSLGFGGTNAHVVLEEADPLKSGDSRPWQLLILSARTESALKAMAANLAAHLKQNPEVNLADVACTYKVGRRAFSHRRMVVVRSREDAAIALEQGDPRQAVTQDLRPVCFMFPGQGAQHVNMARQLYERERTFREVVDNCLDELTDLPYDLMAVLYPEESRRAEAERHLGETCLTQPALFAIEYALAQLWIEWGIIPSAMIGHSIGEYTAACLAGVFSVKDALHLVALRGKLMQEMPKGSMLAVPLPEEEARPLTGERLDLAAVNGPSLSVISGPDEAIEELKSRLTGQRIACRRLHTSHAFHSRMMEPILERFAAEVGKIHLNPPQIPYISNLTGTWITAEQAISPNYWAAHLRHTVCFYSGVSELMKDPRRVFLEVGPGNALATLLRWKSERTILTSLPHPLRKEEDMSSLLHALGHIWLSGVHIDWNGFYRHEKRCRVPLPTYPFERRRYWIEPKIAPSAPLPTLDKKANIAEWFYTPAWTETTGSYELCRSADKKRWLVFLDECGIGDRLTAFIKKAGHEVTTVAPAAAFSKSHGYAIVPHRLEDYEALCKDLSAAQIMPEVIVHLWNIAASKSLSLPKGETNFYSLLNLTRALAGEKRKDPLEILVVTEGLWRIGEEESIRPEQALSAGMCEVISLECAGITCRNIDLPVGKAERHIERLFTEPGNSETKVAYRGDSRWTRTFRKVELGEREQNPRLKNGGVYLITGGLGGIGLSIAEYLAKTVEARLILVGRTPFPERECWERPESCDEKTARRIRKLKELEQIGGKVLVLCADVSDEEAMRAVSDRVRESFGELNGIIHAAGIAGGGLIQLRTLREAQAVFAPKVKGTSVLSEVFKDARLDFFLLCSSLSSILGAIGEVDYCAANAFLDAFAWGGRETFTTAVNWDTWQEVGMAVESDIPSQLRKFREESIHKGIRPFEGMEAFHRILSSRLRQVIVSTRDLPLLMEQHRKLNAVSALEKLGEDQGTRHSRPKLKTDYVAPGNQMERDIAHLWEKLLGIAPIGIRDNFFELGGHSLLAVRLMGRLKDLFAVELPLRCIFEKPTVGELASLIAEKMVPQEDEEAVSKVLDELERLSDE